MKVEHFAVGKLEGGECKGGGLRVEDRFTIIQCFHPALHNTPAVNSNAPVVKISHVFQVVATGAHHLKLEFENHKKKNNISFGCLDPNTLRQIFLEISRQN